MLDAATIPSSLVSASVSKYTMYTNVLGKILQVDIQKRVSLQASLATTEGSSKTDNSYDFSSYLCI